ncbi:MAG: NAD(P)H-dependent oxidoreductase, partial [Acidobacteria bacterium]
MMNIVGIAGSLRKGSYNASLLLAAKKEVPEGTELEIASIRGIPLYDGDVETETGIPDLVTDLKNRIAASAG